jgi:hypothetical protein
MLPSFRLIAATFLCGFFVVFVGLRMAVSLNDIHEGLPVMAAHAAPIPVTPPADREARRGVSAVPVMYDLRFAVTPVSPILVRATPSLIERPLPSLPLSILPPDIAPATLAEPDTSVAAIDRDAEVAPAATAVSEPPAAIMSEPLPPLDAAADTPAPEAKAATIEPPATVPVEETATEPLVTEPETTPSVDVAIPAQDAAAAKPVEPATQNEPVEAATQNEPVEAATKKEQAKPEPEHAKRAAKAVAKPKPVRKPRIRTARRATPAAFDVNNPSTQPFGGPTQTR